MSDRSNSGVRNIRAMFEAKSEQTSPPSRGRSPVGSEGAGTRSTSSRPLSKVRTSFVAVERSGQLGTQLGLRRMSSNGEAAQGTDPGSDTRPSTTSEIDRPEAPKINGNGDGNLNGCVDSAPALEKVKEEELSNGSKEALSDQKEDTALLLEHSDHALDAAKSPVNGDAPSSKDKDLGSVLKGSPFNPEESAKSPTLQETIASNADTQHTKTPSKTNAAVEGTPTGTKSGSPSKSKPLISRPMAIRTKKDIGGSPQVKTPGKASKSSSSPRTPKTPATQNAQPSSKVSSPRQPLSKTASPKLSLPTNGGKKLSELNKGPTKKASRTSIASSVSTTTAKQQPPTSTVPSKKPASSSTSTSTSAKPKPKSPTRPARLPAAATAPTAASAARLSGAPQSRSPSRTGTTTISRKPLTLNKDASTSRFRGPQTGSTSTKIASRPPPTSNPAAEGPKPRNVVGKAPDEGFLARMMRPTASSASKVHDKTEQKSPPGKAASVKPKRKSEVSDEAKPKHPDPTTIPDTPAEDHSLAGAPGEEFPTGEISGAADDAKESGVSSEPVAT
ncbi:hypothetical protein MMC14_009194 [Varicellaria rhodocarpa]|nr:hypothetical protein [Varicellaria rhodocarpa]